MQNLGPCHATDRVRQGLRDVTPPAAVCDQLSWAFFVILSGSEGSGPRVRTSVILLREPDAWVPKRERSRLGALHFVQHDKCAWGSPTKRSRTPAASEGLLRLSRRPNRLSWQRQHEIAISLFGADTNGDGAVDAYLTAAEVTAANRWDRVYSVRVSLVAVSTEAVTNSGSQVIYLRDTDGDTVADAQTTAADRRLRQVFTTTVALRNRLP